MFDLVSTLIMAGARPSPASTAFVCNNVDNSLTALNVTNTASISLRSELTDATNLAAPTAIDLDVVSNIAWVVGSTQITAVNISNPASMSVTGSYSSGGWLPGPHAVKLDKARNRAFVLSSSNATITSINTSNPASPTLVQGIASLSGATGGDFAIDLTNNVAYIMASASGPTVRIVAVNIANPASMSAISTKTLTGADGTVGGIALHPNNTTLFVSYGAGDFSVLDVSNPASMVESYNYASLFTLGGPGKVSYLAGDVVLVCASSDDAMKTLNVANLASVSVIDTESGTTYLDECRGHAVDPYNGTIFVVGTNGDDFSAYSRTGGTMTFISNYTSGTSINGPYAVALI